MLPRTFEFMFQVNSCVCILLNWVKNCDFVFFAYLFILPYKKLFTFFLYVHFQYDTNCFCVIKHHFYGMPHYFKVCTKCILRSLRLSSRKLADIDASGEYETPHLMGFLVIYAHQNGIYAQQQIRPLQYNVLDICSECCPTSQRPYKAISYRC